MRLSPPGTHFTAELTEAMQIKYLAQGNNILMPGFEPSTSVTRNRHSNQTTKMLVTEVTPMNHTSSNKVCILHHTCIPGHTHMSGYTRIPCHTCIPGHTHPPHLSPKAIRADLSRSKPREASSYYINNSK